MESTPSLISESRPVLKVLNLSIIFLMSSIICDYFVFINMDVSINNNVFKVITLIDPLSQQIGMMGKKFRHPKQGLLFLMGGKKQCFWMKNCIIPLDIIIKIMLLSTFTIIVLLASKMIVQVSVGMVTLFWSYKVGPVIDSEYQREILLTTCFR